MESYIQIESLHLFLKVIEAGSFSAVCKSTKMPKATLSRKISQLEGNLGAQLFVRNTRSLKLTELGREILSRAKVIVAAHEDSKSIARNTKAEPQGLLRVTAGVEFGLNVISPLATEYCKKYPAVQVELDLTGRSVDLIYEGFDLAVRIGPLDDSSLSARRLGSFRYGLFAAPELIKKYRIKGDLEVLRDVPTLGFTRVDKHLSWRLRSSSEEREIKIQPRMMSNNYAVLCDAAVDGLGVVYMPIFLAQQAVASKKLVQLFSRWQSIEIPVHFVYPSQRFLSPKVRTFVDFTLQRLKF